MKEFIFKSNFKNKWPFSQGSQGDTNFLVCGTPTRKLVSAWFPKTNLSKCVQ